MNCRTWARAVVSLLWMLGTAAPTRAVPPVELELVVSVSDPLYVTHAGDDRLFIAERQGRILIYEEGSGLLPTPFLDISGLVDTGGDGGFFAVAFHPDFASNGFFFVSYTKDGSGGSDLGGRCEARGCPSAH